MCYASGAPGSPARSGTPILEIEAVTEPWARAAAQHLPEAPFGAPASGAGTSTSRQPPDLRHVVERVAAERPDALRTARADGRFTDLVVAALRESGGSRWGHHRDAGGRLSRGLVTYYRGAGVPVEGATDIAVRAITQGAEPDLVPSWADATAIEPGSWTP